MACISQKLTKKGTRNNVYLLHKKKKGRAKRAIFTIFYQEKINFIHVQNFYDYFMQGILNFFQLKEYLTATYLRGWRVQGYWTPSDRQ